MQTLNWPHMVGILSAEAGEINGFRSRAMQRLRFHHESRRPVLGSATRRWSGFGARASDVVALKAIVKLDGLTQRAHESR